LVQSLLCLKKISGGTTMKASSFIIGAGVAMLLITACSTSRTASVGVYYDDIYYVPGENRDRPEKMFSEVPAISNEALKAEKKELAAQRREYEANSQAQQDTRDFSAIQEEYVALLGNENHTEVDTLLYYDDETGYWVNEFNGSQMDRDYAERLIRFHGPTIRIPYHSPFYSEVVYFNHYDWNVYVDGNYAYAVPSWTNRWYDHYYYNNWYSPYSWHFGWNWGYNNWYFGYGWNYPYYGYGWGYPYYGWGYPYYGYGSYYGWGHNHGHYWASSDRNTYRGPRTGMGSSTRLEGTRGLRNDVRSTVRERGASTASRAGTTSRSSSRDVQSNSTTRTRENAGVRQSATTRASYGRGVDNATGSRTSRQTTTRTRSSYTPSYTTPEGNTRPSYNRATYSRENAGTQQSTGTVQGSSSSGTRQSASSSTSSPSYNDGARQSATRPSSTTSRPSSSSTYQRGSSSSSTNRSYSGRSSSGRSSSYSGGSRSSYSGGSGSSSYSGGGSSGRSSGGGSYSGGSSGSSRSSGGGRR
jgi:hypothetical protein